MSTEYRSNKDVNTIHFSPFHFLISRMQLATRFIVMFCTCLLSFSVFCAHLKYFKESSSQAGCGVWLSLLKECYRNMLWSSVQAKNRRKKTIYCSSLEIRGLVSLSTTSLRRVLESDVGRWPDRSFEYCLRAVNSRVADLGAFFLAVNLTCLALFLVKEGQ